MSWKEEFYRISAENLELATDKVCLEHCIRKWKGLLKENLDKYGIVFDDNNNPIIDDEPFPTDASSCVCFYFTIFSTNLTSFCIW